MPSTIADVARRAGVSTATVSRVLARVSASRPETVARVMAAVEELEYRPSGIARSLKLRTTQTIGLIVTDIQNPYFPELVRAIEDAARDYGHAVLLCNAANDREREARYLDLLAERRVDGVIVAASQLTERHAAWLERSPVPIVIVNNAPVSGVPAILTDDEGGARLAAEHVLALGHRRLGVIAGPAEHSASAPRLAGVRAAVARARLAHAVELAVAAGDAQVDGGARAARELIERSPEITALVCYNDLSAIGALRALREAGRRVPEDVSVVGFDDIDAAAWVEPALTTVAQQKTAMGRWAVGRLSEILRGAGGPADIVRLPVELRIRGSTAPPPTRPRTRRAARTTGHDRTGGTE